MARVPGKQPAPVRTGDNAPAQRLRSSCSSRSSSITTRPASSCIRSRLRAVVRVSSKKAGPSARQRQAHPPAAELLALEAIELYHHAGGMQAWQKAGAGRGRPQGAMPHFSRPSCATLEQPACHAALAATRLALTTNARKERASHIARPADPPLLPASLGQPTRPAAADTDSHGPMDLPNKALLENR